MIVPLIAMKKRAREIMKFLIEHNTHTRMHFEVDASLLSDEMMDFLDQVPPDRFYFEIGIQSTIHRLWKR